MTKVTVDLEVTDKDRWNYVLKNVETFYHHDYDGDLVDYDHLFSVRHTKFEDVVAFIDEQIIMERFAEARS